MTGLQQLGLTPAQLVECERADEQLVAAWLAALDAQPGLRSPAGWFLSGVRSGNAPVVQADAREQSAMRRAEWRIRNIGYCLLTESELRGELYGRGGPLEHYPRAGWERLYALWREQRRAPPIPWPSR